MSVLTQNPIEIILKSAPTEVDTLSKVNRQFNALTKVDYIRKEHATIYSYIRYGKYIIDLKVAATLEVRDMVMKGNLVLVKYLHSIGKFELTSVSRAAQRGDLEMLKYLFSVGYRYSYDVMEFAIHAGRLDVVKYLYEVMGKICASTLSWVATAYRCGLELVQYIASKGTRVTFNDIVAVAVDGKLDILKYLLGIYRPRTFIILRKCVKTAHMKAKTHPKIRKYLEAFLKQDRIDSYGLEGLFGNEG